MEDRFLLTLVVNHACNLRCDYCYTGQKLHRPMPDAYARKAIERALQSLAPRGVLELGFFGGEPLIESTNILAWLAYARARAAERELRVEPCLTTNGTITSPNAWQVMTDRDLHLSISCDGLPDVHDRHRTHADGSRTFARVRQTLAELIEHGKPFRAVMVVAPDSQQQLARGIEHLYERGVREFDLSLDLWSKWSHANIEQLEQSIREATDFWAAHLPEISVNWFDDKAAQLAHLPQSQTARCDFGRKQIAVAPSGNLYPCERLVSADAPRNSMRMPGHVCDEGPLAGKISFPNKSAIECSGCALDPVCSTSCRCSNFLRTGDIRRPDALLCACDRACFRETARSLEARITSKRDVYERSLA